jgi:hypothetical protein
MMQIKIEIWSSQVALNAGTPSWEIQHLQDRIADPTAAARGCVLT